MVKDGATLADAGRVYGISRERVRQILKGEGVSAKAPPGRAEPRGRRFAYPRGLAPVIEAMWREGMLYHEIARVFDISWEAVRQPICKRVPAPERTAHWAERLEDGRSSDERVLQGVRKAASALAACATIKPGDRCRAQAAIDGWLAAHAQLAEAPNAASPTELTEPVDATSPRERVTPAELRSELDRFKAELRAGGLSGSTVHLYLVGSSLFVRWLAGDYVPGPGRRAERASARGAVRS